MSPDAVALPEGVADALPPVDPQAAVKTSAAADASSAPPWRIRMGPHAVPPSWGPPPADLRGSATPGRVQRCSEGDVAVDAVSLDDVAGNVAVHRVGHAFVLRQGALCAGDPAP